MLKDRYAGQRKTARNEALHKYAQEHPDVTYEEIGKQFNISKQRVSELIKNEEKKKTTEAEATVV